MKNLVWLLLTGFFLNTTWAQEKSLNAYRTNTPPKIDGVLSEPMWSMITPATDFIINSPNFGEAPKQRTKVFLAYDDVAIYIGAMLYDDPKLIRKQLTKRDGEGQQDIDYFSVFFDTYNDDQNGFQFLVTARNVQSDGRISPSVQSRFGPPSDYSWDAVWESNTKITDSGWVVEMSIPYISLRFAKVKVQNWGLNFQRYVRRNNESSYWNPINPNLGGFVNQFGNLKELDNIEPPLRLSVLPYVNVGFRNTPTQNGTIKEFLRNGGMDIKYGINESFTLDATLVPDFGQVISDNVVLNLSPFEVQFVENRPFFTEGTELFNKAGIFYSRRIGATPTKYYQVSNMVASDSNLRLVKNPSVTQLINASKFSGRNKRNLGIGVFNAIGAPMFAEITNVRTGINQKIETEPLTNYNILVIDQLLKNRSYITFTNTNVLRNGSAKDANVSAIDVAFFDKNNQYSILSRSRYSKLFGKDGYDGYANFIAFRKVSGKLQFDVSNNIESDTYNPNDLGILRAPNEVTYRANVSWNQFTPTKNFISYSYSLSYQNQYLFKPYKWQESTIQARGFWFFKNFWDMQIHFQTAPFWYNDFFELRTPGKVLKRTSYYYVGLSGSTDSRKRLFVRWNMGHGDSPVKDDVYRNWQLGARFRFSDRLSLELSTQREIDLGQFGYSFRREANGDPILGRRINKTFTTLLQGVYNFTSRMNLTLRARHYWSNVVYTQFFNVDDKGNWIDRPFISGADNNYNAYNLDMFYTWDFKYGSRLVVGWKNWLGADFNIDGNRYNKYAQNLAQVFSLPQGNELTVRLIYFIDSQQFLKKQKS